MSDSGNQAQDLHMQVQLLLLLLLLVHMYQSTENCKNTIQYTT